MALTRNTLPIAVQLSSQQIALQLLNQPLIGTHLCHFLHIITAKSVPM